MCRMNWIYIISILMINSCLEKLFFKNIQGTLKPSYGVQYLFIVNCDCDVGEAVAYPIYKKCPWYEQANGNFYHITAYIVYKYSIIRVWRCAWVDEVLFLFLAHSCNID